MTALPIFRLVERAKAGVDQAEREGRLAEFLWRFVDDAATDCAQMEFLRLETRLAQAGSDLDEETAQAIMAEIALRSIEFAKIVEPHLKPFLPDLDEWAAVRAFTGRLVELAHRASAGGRA